MKNNTIVLVCSVVTDGTRDQTANRALGVTKTAYVDITIYRDGTVTRERQEVTTDFRAPRGRKGVEIQLDLADVRLIRKAEELFGITIPA